MTTSLRDRILKATSVPAVNELLGELASYKEAGRKTVRRCELAAAKRIKQLS